MAAGNIEALLGPEDAVTFLTREDLRKTSYRPGDMLRLPPGMGPPRGPPGCVWVREGSVEPPTQEPLLWVLVNGEVARQMHSQLQE
ncbi:hypothetical protein ACFL6C_06490 [Myxococcota bacterium]